jgi:hypothetical protein
MFDWLDSDLVEYDESDNILKIFHRPKDMSRAMYRYIASEIIESQTDCWNEASQCWKNLPNSKKEILEKKAQMEFQNFLDIRQGLLATLADYQGFINIKSQFRDLILSAEFK